MIQIGSPKIKIIEGLLAQEVEGVKFEVVKRSGLNIICSHNAADDASAKKLIKGLLANTPTLKNAFSSVQIVDENGRII